MNVIRTKTAVVTIALAIVVSGCSKSLDEQVVNRSTGVITEREIVEVVKEKTKPRSSIRLSSGSRSGGGIGMGFSLLFPLGNNEPETTQLSRFTVKLDDGTERTVDYPDDDLFIGDCIDIIEVEGSDEPPMLELSADSCAFAQ